ncbi:MAG TPA: type II CAAX endopeptidase family protein [Candidatus Saccharimonadales bacterium]|nr:type II CAAX endopeptidase family protein [Candidatus Saccharimonadales bacterium]
MSDATFKFVPDDKPSKASKKALEAAAAQATTDANDVSRGPLWSGFTAVLVVIAVYMISLYVGGGLLALYAAIHHWSSAYANNWLSNSVPAQFFYVLIDETITVLLLWGFLKWRRYKGVLRALGLGRPRFEDMRYVFTGLLAYFVLYILIVNFAAKFINLDVGQQQDIGFQVANSRGDLLLTFLSLVILPPLIEETVFRGFLFAGLRKSMRFVGAALITSALFAVPHLFEGASGRLLWTAGIDTFILSLVLCFAREKTGKLWAGMTIHGLKNFVAFYILFIHH